MTTVLVAVIGGLTAIATGLVPFLLGARQRLLRVIDFEQRLVREIPDGDSRERLDKALAVTTTRYLRMVEEDPAERVRRRVRALRFPLTVSLVEGVSMLILGNVHESETAAWVGIGFIGAFTLAGSTLSAQWMYYRQEARRSKVQSG